MSVWEFLASLFAAISIVAALIAFVSSVHAHGWGYVFVAALGCFGLWTLVHIVGPMVDLRTLTPKEIWVVLISASLCVWVPLGMIVHALHENHRHKTMWGVGVATIAALTALWVTSPVNYLSPPPAPAAPPPVASGAPTPPPTAAPPVPPSTPAPRKIKIGKVADEETPCYLLPGGCKK